MAIRQSAADRGARRGRVLRHRVAEDLASARRTCGLSYREVARQLHVGHDRVARAERGDPAALTIDFAAGFASVVGLQLSIALYPAGDPVRDSAHLALLERLRVRLGPGLRWRTEVPIPVAGDQRAADAVIDGPVFGALVEAETHVHDIQALERRVSVMQRDLGLARVILLVAATRHNRQVIAAAPELRRRFPLDTRGCLAALRRGQDPGADALVIL